MTFDIIRAARLAFAGCAVYGALFMICRVEKSRDYTVMSNYHLRDRKLSLKAKGLLSVVLSLPEDWDYSIAGLCAICKESTCAVNSALTELKAAGYLVIEKIYPDKSTSGRIEYIYIFKEHPAENQADEKQEVEKQGIENQGLEFQALENPVQLNTNKSITKELNTNYILYCQIVIDYLNKHAGTRYRHDTPETVRLITRLLDQGYSVADITEVIDKKVNEWSGTAYAKYLRPSTLFGSKFESYLNTPEKQWQNGGKTKGLTDRFPPTYDVSEIESLLDAEWNSEEGD